MDVPQPLPILEKPVADWVRERDEYIRRYNNCDNSVREMSRRYGVPRSTLGDWYRKHLIDDTEEVLETTVTPDSAKLVSGNLKYRHSPDELIKLHKLDPKDWTCGKMSIAEKETKGADGKKISLFTMRLELVRKRVIEFIVPAREPLKKFKTKQIDFDGDKPLLGVFVGDQQIPKHNTRLHNVFCQWLACNKPDFGTIVGDFIDVPSPSRHPAEPDWDDTLQACIDGGYAVAKDYREAWEQCVWDMLIGNHDERIKKAVLAFLKELHGLRRASLPGDVVGDGVLTLRHLMRFDELDISIIQPKGPYTHAQRVYCDDLTARHGWLTGKTAAAKSIERLMHSLIFGHTHHMSVETRTLYGSDGNHKTIIAIENPAMCEIPRGLGYAVDPNWVNGWTTVQLWKDGRFSFEQAVYQDGVVTWRDQRFEA